MPLYKMDTVTAPGAELAFEQGQAVDIAPTPAEQAALFEEPPGFFEKVWLTGKHQMIAGALAKRLAFEGVSFFADRDAAFNPMDEFTPELVKNHPWLEEDFRSGRVLDIPNKRAFNWWVRLRDEDFSERQILMRHGTLTSGIAASVFDGPLLLLGAESLGWRGVGEFIKRGSLLARTGKMAGLGGLSLTSWEAARLAADPAETESNSAALVNAAIMGSALGAAIPTLGAGLGAASGLLPAGLAIRMQKDVGRALTKPLAADARKMVDQEVADLRAMLDEAPGAPRSISPLRHPSTEPLIEELRKKYADAGVRLHVEDDLQRQPLVSALAGLEDLEESLQGLAPTIPGLRGKFADLVSMITPGARARKALLGDTRQVLRVVMDDYFGTIEGRTNPLDARAGPTIESLRHGYQNMKGTVQARLDAILRDHFASGGKEFTYTAAGGMAVRINHRMSRRVFGEAVLDHVRELEARRVQQKAGVDPGPMPDVAAPIQKAAEAYSEYPTRMLDVSEDAGILRGRKALAQAQADLAELEKKHAELERKEQALFEKEGKLRAAEHGEAPAAAAEAQAPAGPAAPAAAQSPAVAAAGRDLGVAEKSKFTSLPTDILGHIFYAWRPEVYGLRKGGWFMFGGRRRRFMPLRIQAEFTKIPAHAAKLIGFVRQLTDEVIELQGTSGRGHVLVPTQALTELARPSFGIDVAKELAEAEVVQQAKLAGRQARKAEIALAREGDPVARATSRSSTQGLLANELLSSLARLGIRPSQAEGESQLAMLIRAAAESEDPAMELLAKLIGEVPPGQKIRLMGPDALPAGSKLHIGAKTFEIAEDADPLTGQATKTLRGDGVEIPTEVVGEIPVNRVDLPKVAEEPVVPLAAPTPPPPHTGEIGIPEPVVQIDTEFAKLAAQLDESAKLLDAKRQEVELVTDFVERAPHHATMRWLSHEIMRNRDEFLGRLVGQWRSNRSVHWKTGKAIPQEERPLIEGGLSALTDEERVKIAEREITNEADLVDQMSPSVVERYEKGVEDYFQRAAKETADRNTLPDNAHGVAAAFGGANPTMARVLQVDPRNFRDFLDQDIYRLMDFYDTAVGGKAAILNGIRLNRDVIEPVVKKYLPSEIYDGSLDQVIRAVDKEKQAKITSARAIDKVMGTNFADRIEKNANKLRDILIHTTDELRGAHSIPSSLTQDVAWKAVGRIVMRLPFLAWGGQFLVSSMTDAPSAVFLAGRTKGSIRRFAKALIPFTEMPRSGLESFSRTLDEAIASRGFSLHDIEGATIDPRLATSLGDKLLARADMATSAASRLQSVISGMNWWNRAWMRSSARNLVHESSVVLRKMVQADDLRKSAGISADEAMAKVGLDKNLAQRWNRLGINAAEARKAWALWKKHGVVGDKKLSELTDDELDKALQNGAAEPNLSKWFDEDRDTYFRYSGAVDTELGAVIATPSLGSRPLLNKYFLGRMFNQFWSFAYAWGNQTLPAAAGISSGGTEFASFMGMMVGMGALVDAIKNHLSGRRSFSETAELWEKEPLGMMQAAVNRSGVISWMTRPIEWANATGYGPGPLLGNDVSSLHTGMSRGWLGKLGGPAFDLLDRAGHGAWEAIHGRDLHTLRTVEPYQNNLWMKLIYRTTSDMGMNNPFGEGKGLDLFIPPTLPEQEWKKKQTIPTP